MSGMTIKKTKELKPQKVIIHLTDEDHQILVQSAIEQSRTITGQAYFWLSQTIKLRKDSIRKRDFQNQEYE